MIGFNNIAWNGGNFKYQQQGQNQASKIVGAMYDNGQLTLKTDQDQEFEVTGKNLENLEKALTGSTTNDAASNVHKALTTEQFQKQEMTQTDKVGGNTFSEAEG